MATETRIKVKRAAPRYVVRFQTSVEMIDRLFLYMRGAMDAAVYGLAIRGVENETASIVEIESGATLRRYETNARGIPRCTYRMR